MDLQNIHAALSGYQQAFENRNIDQLRKRQTEISRASAPQVKSV
jgi:hypothetical protein